jgi:hypothetical protein
MINNNGRMETKNPDTKLLLLDYLKDVAKGMAKSVIKYEPPLKQSSEKIEKEEEFTLNNIQFKVAKYQKMPMYDKKVMQKQRFENKMQKIRNKKVKEEAAKFSHSPKISDKSKKISNGVEPIYNRIDKILIDKQIKRNFLQHTHMEKILVPPSKNTYNQRLFDKWVNDQVAKKKEQLRKIIEEKEKHEKLMMDSLFKPNISRTPDSISYYKAYDSNRSTGRQSIYEKLYNHEEFEKIEIKKFNMLEKLTPSFKPTINKRVPNFKNHSLNNSYFNSRNLSKVHSKIITDLPSYKDNSGLYHHRSVNTSFRGEKLLKTNEDNCDKAMNKTTMNSSQIEQKREIKSIILKGNEKNKNLNKRNMDFSHKQSFQNQNTKIQINKTTDFNSESTNHLEKHIIKEVSANVEKKKQLVSYNVSEPSEVHSKLVTSYDINVANFTRNGNNLIRKEIKQKRVPVSIRIIKKNGITNNTIKERVKENKNNSMPIRK